MEVGGVVGGVVVEGMIAESGSPEKSASTLSGGFGLSPTWGLGMNPPLSHRAHTYQPA